MRGGAPDYPVLFGNDPGNLRAIKEFVNKKFSTIFRFGSYSLKEVRLQTTRSGLALANGVKLVPMVKYKPITDEQFEIASQNLEEIFFSLGSTPSRK